MSNPYRRLKKRLSREQQAKRTAKIAARATVAQELRIEQAKWQGILRNALAIQTEPLRRRLFGRLKWALLGR